MPNLPPPRWCRSTLRQLWTAPSPKTTLPLVVAGEVVTGDGREVEGRDPATGNALWSYARDLDLCGVTWVYHYAVAVYPDVRGCGQVSTIDAKTGQRGPTRTAYADPEVTLSSDGTTVLSAGDSRLEHVALGHGPDAVATARSTPGSSRGHPPPRYAGWCRRRPAPPRCRCSRPARTRPTFG